MLKGYWWNLNKNVFFSYLLTDQIWKTKVQSNFKNGLASASAKTFLLTFLLYILHEDYHIMMKQTCDFSSSLFTSSSTKHCACTLCSGMLWSNVPLKCAKSKTLSKQIKREIISQSKLQKKMLSPFHYEHMYLPFRYKIQERIISID